MLERQAVEVEKNELFGFEELGKKASELLGYDVLQKAAESKKGFAQVLLELDIKPFSSEKVMIYKKHQLKANSNFLSRHETFFFVMAERILPVIILLSVASTFILFGASAISYFGWVSWGFSWLWSMISGMLCAAFFALVVLTDYIIVVTANWQRVALSYYKEPVPEFALQTAVDIAGRTDEVEFFVDRLVINKRTLDPFLVARCKKDTTDYYLEVWNEPGFKQERKI